MASTFEYTANSVEEAITRGLNALGMNRDDVEISILDNGSRGLFGIGARPAKVSLMVKEASLRAAVQKAEEPLAAAPLEVPAAESVAEAPKAPAPEKRQPREPREPKPRQPRPAAAPAPVQNEGAPKPVATPAAETAGEAAEEGAVEVVNEETMQIAVHVVRDLMEKMHVKAELASKITEAADEVDSRVISIDIRGDDLSYLIGRHSEVLHSLQYIASLIVGREVGHWVPLVIDVQGYRERRERQLRQMAARMADQVSKTGRRISLEPMPATERRIIHLALRDSEFVTTESVGEEPNRKVMIYPKAK